MAIRVAVSKCLIAGLQNAELEIVGTTLQLATNDLDRLMRYGLDPSPRFAQTTISSLSPSAVKSSAPYAASGPDRFAARGSDMTYSLTVTDNGGSPVDAGTIVLTDLLPADVASYNGDFNAGSPGMGPFEVAAGTSGVSLPARGRAYSSNAGSTYGYTPAAGYDGAIDDIRLTPSGSMAPNSSFTIRFRAKVN